MDAGALELCDSLNALRYLLKKYDFCGIGGHAVNVILAHHIYAVVQDKNCVDREVFELRRAGLVRQMRMLASPTSTFLALETEYRGAVLAVSRAKRENGEEKASLAFELFATFVLPNCSDLFIEDEVLRARLEAGCKGKRIGKSDMVEPLLNEGFLLHRTNMPEVKCYWFAVPKVGSLVKWILEARAELKHNVAQSPHKEVLRSHLVAKSLKKSSIHAVYHVEEMVASRRLRAFDAISDGEGQLIRPGYVP